MLGRDQRSCDCVLCSRHVLSCVTGDIDTGPFIMGHVTERANNGSCDRARKQPFGGGVDGSWSSHVTRLFRLFSHVTSDCVCSISRVTVVSPFTHRRSCERASSVIRQILSERSRVSDV